MDPKAFKEYLKVRMRPCPYCGAECDAVMQGKNDNEGKETPWLDKMIGYNCLKCGHRVIAIKGRYINQQKNIKN